LRQCFRGISKQNGRAEGRARLPQGRD